MAMRILTVSLVFLGGALFLQIGERLAVPGLYGIIAPAQAIVGRPLTPVSVAGVSRRTARRCAVGVYNC